MPANIATNKSGTAAFVSLREMPWHREGIVVQEELPGLEFLQVAGLDYQVDKFPLKVEIERPDGPPKATGWNTETDQPVYTQEVMQEYKKHPLMGVARTDTYQVLPGVVGEGYTHYQNTEMISFFEGLAKDRKIVYEVAGALGVGEEVWVLARIPDLTLSIKGDESYNYLLIRNGHCGNVTLQVFPTTIRVVCANTMAMAVTERQRNGKLGTAKTGYAIRHTRNMQQVVSRVQKAYADVLSDFDKKRELYEMLAGKEVSQQTKSEFFRWVALQGRDEAKILDLQQRESTEVLSRGEKTSLTNYRTVVDKLEELYESPTNQQPGTRNTLYSTMQTVIEWIDHERGTRCSDGDDCDAQRFESAVFGSGAKLKAAVELRAAELVGA